MTKGNTAHKNFAVFRGEQVYPRFVVQYRRRPSQNNFLPIPNAESSILPSINQIDQEISDLSPEPIKRFASKVVTTPIWSTPDWTRPGIHSQNDHGYEV